MARQVRIEYPNAFYHVISRGYNRAWIFHDNQDFERLLADISVVHQSHCIVIHAYCIMNNHLHLFVETPLANLSKAMHRLFSRYASYYKNKYKSSGKVFEKRYTAYLVDSEIYAIDLSRYIHRNPVGVIVDDPLSWKYSSYRIYQNIERQQDFLDLNLVLKRFDMDKDLAIERMSQHMEREESSIWHPEDYLSGKSILGSKSFIERIKEYLPDDINKEQAGLIALHDSDKVSEFKKRVFQLRLPLHEKIDLLIYVLRKYTSLNSKEINSELNLHLSKSAISKRVSRISEDAIRLLVEII